MPSHPERVRTAPLPAGYQFGDAHEHDYRARYAGAGFVYHAICKVCGHDAGVVNTSGFDVVEGMGHCSRLYTDDFTKVKIGETVRFTFPSWRPRHLNAAEQLARRQFITDRDTGDER